MKRYLLLIFFISVCQLSFAQQQQRDFIDSISANKILIATSKTFPMFYRELQYITQHDSLIKQVRFFRSATPGSPASAGENGVINIDITFLEKPKPDFDDNRMIVVLYHEIGHLHFFVTVPRAQWNPADNERSAFEYSLLKTKQMADKGDCLPLKTGLKFMKLRSESNNLADPHTIALKILVTEPLYFNYIKFVKEHCGG